MTSPAPGLDPDAPQTTPPKRSLLERLGPAGLLGLLWAVAPAFGGILLLARINHASDWLNSHGLAVALAAYVGIFIATAGVGLLPTYPQSILAGWVFGAALGIPAALAGFGGASLIGYAIARAVSQDRVEKVINDNAKARAVRDSLLRSGFWKSLLIVTLVRVPPNSPFALTNGVLAASGVRLVPYFLGTVIGMTPRTAAAVILAANWAANNEGGIVEAVKQRGPTQFIVGIVAAFIVLGVIGALANKAIAKVTEQNAADRAAAEAP